MPKGLPTVTLTVAQLWKVGATVLALAGLYYGMTVRLAVLDERVTALQHTVERQEANIHGLEAFLMAAAK